MKVWVEATIFFIITICVVALFFFALFGKSFNLKMSAFVLVFVWAVLKLSSLLPRRK